MVVELSKDFQSQYNKLIFPKLQYRNSRTGARSTRTQIDHDVFEGLPVRHWRKRSFNVNAAPEKDNLDPLGTGDTGWPELPMPRDAHMYSPMSEALLRAARMGQVKKPATPLMDDEKEPGEDEDADGDLDMGFVAKRWAVIPKDMEGPEPEFLAKRRKGLPSVYAGATGPLRKIKIRKIDTEGNSYIWEVLVPEGQAVDGEVVEEETSPTQAPAPGTVVEGLGVVNAEGVVIAGDQALAATNRRRPPPPKRKAKGPGRGRKKKVASMPGAEGIATANGVSAALNGSSTGVDGGESANLEHGLPDEDIEMGDENVLQEGEEGSEEGSEGEDGEDGDKEEGELSPSPTPAKSPAEPPTIVVNDIKPAEILGDGTPSPSKVSLSPQAEPTRQDSSDPMLLDEDDDEAMGSSFLEPTVTSIAQSPKSTTDVSAPVAAEILEETMTTPEFTPRPSKVVEREPYSVSIVEPQTEAQTESIPIPPPDATLQPRLDFGEQSVTDKITENLAKQSRESLAESLARSGTGPTPDSPVEHATEVIVASTVEAITQQTLGVPAGFREDLDRRTEGLPVVLPDSMPVSSTGAEPELTTNTMSTPTTEAMTEPKGEQEMKLPSEPPTKYVRDPDEESESVAVPVAEQSIAEPSIAEKPIAKPFETEQLKTEPPETEPPETEQLKTEPPETEPLGKEFPKTEPLETEPPETEPPTEPLEIEQPEIEQPETKQPETEQPETEQPETEQPETEQSETEQPETEHPHTERLHPENSHTEQPETQELTMEYPIANQPITEQPRTEQAVTEQTVTEQTVTEQIVTEQTVTEPWARPAAEPFPEAISPERRFSYTRVTTSPQAPTPSPPTPIENTFGLKAPPYLSPKAPTMSPPTPIERSLSSSPDIPLADQHFRLPPQIDAEQGTDTDQAPAPDMVHVPGADRILVKAASKVDSLVNAHTPVEHDPLDGTAEARVAEESEGSTQHFTDGEEDLLGSLERSLGRHGGRS